MAPLSLARVKKKCGALISFRNYEIIRQEPSSQVISYRKKPFPASRSADKLGIDKTGPSFRMERVQYADGIPVVYEVAVQRNLLRISIEEGLPAIFVMVKIGKSQTSPAG